MSFDHRAELVRLRPFSSDMPWSNSSEGAIEMASRSLPVRLPPVSGQRSCKPLASAPNVRNNTDLCKNFNTRLTPSFSYTFTRFSSRTSFYSPAAVAATSSKMSTGDTTLSRRRTPKCTTVYWWSKFASIRIDEPNTTHRSYHTSGHPRAPTVASYKRVGVNPCSMCLVAMSHLFSNSGFYSSLPDSVMLDLEAGVSAVHTPASHVSQIDHTW